MTKVTEAVCLLSFYSSIIALVSFNSSLIDFLGNENTSVPEHQSFLAHSNINDEINGIPQIINPPNDALYVLPTYEEPRQIHYTTPSSSAMAHEPQPQNHQLYGEYLSGISNSNSIFQNQDPLNVPGPSNIDSYFGHFRHTREPRQIHYITPFSFAMANVPQSQNHQLFGEVFPEISDTNSIFQNQDPWNVPGPSNIDSYFGHFRHTRDIGTYEADEDLRNIVELVESVIQSP
ncbi:uncharacterized protein LOC110095725 [Dendrobium catenatum]|uniref:uncharacterized protein LOC110095725 n=1 Tax=Dendrobium catenatum TaxID=906689 RepID=UPI00109F2095|nr:uncharacterized protein LOC110095725 [Dendrobium catenatum]